MGQKHAVLHAVTIGVHVLAAGALGLLLLKTGTMGVFCVGSGALIGCAAVPARPGRSPTLYIAFGVLMGYAFWTGVSAVNMGVFFYLIPALLLGVGAAWFLEQPGWPSVLFTGIMDLLIGGLVALELRYRPPGDVVDPEHLRRSTLTSGVVLSVGLVYLVLGFIEAMLGKPKKKKRSRRAVLRRAERPPEVDEDSIEESRER
jgi:hypothetical protein